MLDDSRVGYARNPNVNYHCSPPYSPSENFPEYPFGVRKLLDNEVYGIVREAFHNLGLDSLNYGTSQWNPLGKVISPGDRVVVKPNLVNHQSDRNDGDVSPVITSGAVLRAVLDYVWIALKGRGEIIIADSPLGAADWKLILEETGLDRIVDFLKKQGNVKVRTYDLRRETWVCRDGVIFDRRRAPQDPESYVIYDLGKDSYFFRFRGEGRYYGADFDYQFVNAHHHDSTHEYLVAGTIISANAFIHVPKLKTHKSAGITCCLKGLVGINGDKNYLPHYTKGPGNRGGDESPDFSMLDLLEDRVTDFLERITYRWGKSGAWIHYAIKEVVKTFMPNRTIAARAGHWPGNDTMWRMVLDLNRILFYGSRDGKLNAQVQRNHFAIVDAIVGGQGNGPLAPDPIVAGTILCGENPLAVDTACAQFMGFKIEDIPIIWNAWQDREKIGLANFGPGEVLICGGDKGFSGFAPHWPENQRVEFQPHPAWIQFLKNRLDRQSTHSLGSDN